MVKVSLLEDWRSEEGVCAQVISGPSSSHTPQLPRPLLWRGETAGYGRLRQPLTTRQAVQAYCMSNFRQSISECEGKWENGKMRFTYRYARSMCATLWDAYYNIYVTRSMNRKYTQRKELGHQPQTTEFKQTEKYSPSSTKSPNPATRGVSSAAPPH